MGKDFENVKDIFIRLYANNRRYLTDEEISKLTEEEIKMLNMIMLKIKVIF